MITHLHIHRSARQKPKDRPAAPLDRPAPLFASAHPCCCLALVCSRPVLDVVAAQKRRRTLKKSRSREHVPPSTSQSSVAPLKVELSKR